MSKELTTLESKMKDLLFKHIDDTDQPNRVLFNKIEDENDFSFDHQIFSMLDKDCEAYNLIESNGGITRMFEMYLNDIEIASATDTRRRSAVNTPWTLEGGDESVKEFISDQLMPLIPKFMDDMSWAIPFGRAVTQVIWDENWHKQTGEYRIHSLQPEKVDNFYPTLDGGLAKKNGYFQDMQAVDFNQKFVWAVKDQSIFAPHGLPLYASLYYAYIYRRHAWMFFMEGLEKTGKPIIHAKVEATNPSLNKKTKAQLIYEAMAGKKRKSAIITGLNDEINMLSAKSDTQGFVAALNLLQEELIRRILGQNLVTSSAKNGGSLAQGKVHNEVYAEVKSADCKILCSPVQQLVHYIFTLNDLKGEEPKFIMRDPKGLELETAQVDVLVKQANPGLKFTDQYLLRKHHYREGDFIISTEDAEALEFAENEESDYQFVDRNNLNPKQKATLDLQEDALKMAGDSVDFEEFGAIVAASKNEKELAENLGLMIGKEDHKYTETLTKLIFASRLKGFVDAKEDI